MKLTPEHVRTPRALKKIPERDLQKFASVCRRRLIKSVSKSGGHFGASLGVCELTVACITCLIFRGTKSSGTWDIRRISTKW